MNTTSSRLGLAAMSALLSVVLAACASPGRDSNAHGHATSTSDGGGMRGQQGMMMDMQAMCEMHKQQMAGKSPSERQSMMAAQMQSMSPEMRDRMQSMMRQCD